MAAIIPPLNFELVLSGVYRSGFPTRKNVAFLRRLGLRSVLRLCSTPYSSEVLDYMAASGVRVIDCATEGNREPLSCIPEQLVRRALGALTSAASRPILVHCINGQQTTGCIVGLLRRVDKWALSAIFEEYRRHVTGGRVRALDLQLIETCRLDELLADEEGEGEGEGEGAGAGASTDDGDAADDMEGASGGSAAADGGEATELAGAQQPRIGVSPCARRSDASFASAAASIAEEGDSTGG